MLTPPHLLRHSGGCCGWFIGVSSSIPGPGGKNFEDKREGKKMGPLSFYFKKAPLLLFFLKIFGGFFFLFENWTPPPLLSIRVWVFARLLLLFYSKNWGASFFCSKIGLLLLFPSSFAFGFLGDSSSSSTEKFRDLFFGFSKLDSSSSSLHSRFASEEEEE